jgi:hypothetical protein
MRFPIATIDVRAAAPLALVSIFRDLTDTSCSPDRDRRRVSVMDTPRERMIVKKCGMKCGM